MKNLFYVYIAMLPSTRNPHVHQVHSGFCVPCLLHYIAQNKF